MKKQLRKYSVIETTELEALRNSTVHDCSTRIGCLYRNRVRSYLERGGLEKQTRFVLEQILK